MKTKTFEKGEKVRVDRSGAGEGYVFMTIKDSVKTDNSCPLLFSNQLLIQRLKK